MYTSRAIVLIYNICTFVHDKGKEEEPTFIWVMQFLGWFIWYDLWFFWREDGQEKEIEAAEEETTAAAETEEI